MLKSYPPIPNINRDNRWSSKALTGLSCKKEPKTSFAQNCRKRLVMPIFNTIRMMFPQTSASWAINCVMVIKVHGSQSVHDRKLIWIHVWARSLWLTTCANIIVKERSHASAGRGPAQACRESVFHSMITLLNYVLAFAHLSSKCSNLFKGRLFLLSAWDSMFSLAAVLKLAFPSSSSFDWYFSILFI